MKVSLHGAEFFACHGFYPEEQILGNKFILNIDVEFQSSTDLSGDELNDTINYEKLYQIAEAEMRHTRKLLETVAQSITDRIRREYPQCDAINVELRKLNPPLKGPVAWSAVTISYWR